MANIDIKELRYFNTAKEFFKDGVILDIGAHKGEWSQSIETDKDIYCFEPHPEPFKSLLRNERVIAINKGIGQKNEFKKFYFLPEVQPGSGFVNRDFYKGQKIQEVTLEIVTIDEIIKENIEFAKVDTEGFELDVLIGMTNHLKNKTIRFIQIEYGGTYEDRGIVLNDVINFLKPFGYHVYDFGKRYKRIDNFTDDFIYNNLLITYERI
jgi:FkbM family methyltransferase